MKIDIFTYLALTKYLTTKLGNNIRSLMIIPRFWARKLIPSEQKLAMLDDSEAPLKTTLFEVISKLKNRLQIVSLNSAYARVLAIAILRG